MAIAPRTGETINFKKGVVEAILAARKEHDAFVVEVCAKIADSYSDALGSQDDKDIYASRTAAMIAEEIRQVLVP